MTMVYIVNEKEKKKLTWISWLGEKNVKEKDEKK
jgi:hypothetical protein